MADLAQPALANWKQILTEHFDDSFDYSAFTENRTLSVNIPANYYGKRRDQATRDLIEMLNDFGQVITVDPANLLAHNEDNSVVAKINSDYSFTWQFSGESVNALSELLKYSALTEAPKPDVMNPKVTDAESKAGRDELEQLLEFSS